MIKDELIEWLLRSVQGAVEGIEEATSAGRGPQILYGAKAAYDAILDHLMTEEEE